MPARLREISRPRSCRPAVHVPPPCTPHPRPARAARRLPSFTSPAAGYLPDETGIRPQRRIPGRSTWRQDHTAARRADASDGIGAGPCMVDRVALRVTAPSRVHARKGAMQQGPRPEQQGPRPEQQGRKRGDCYSIAILSNSPPFHFYSLRFAEPLFGNNGRKKQMRDSIQLFNRRPISLRFTCASHADSMRALALRVRVSCGSLARRLRSGRAAGMMEVRGLSRWKEGEMERLLNPGAKQKWIPWRSWRRTAGMRPHGFHEASSEPRRPRKSRARLLQRSRAGCPISPARRLRSLPCSWGAKFSGKCLVRACAGPLCAYWRR